MVLPLWPLNVYVWQKCVEFSPGQPPFLLIRSVLCYCCCCHSSSFLAVHLVFYSIYCPVRVATRVESCSYMLFLFSKKTTRDSHFDVQS